MSLSKEEIKKRIEDITGLLFELYEQEGIIQKRTKQLEKEKLILNELKNEVDCDGKEEQRD